ncbi:MAG: glycosyltransferase family 9 protein [Sporocytophaga sp.]|uniref:glycosyltransferase family 9 protein n=1 Tax=Sporocytophaga sp. TaxID=2231183 RepID=UPI001B2EE9AA|nr:glycosyltransferase family 9 protein [Sporocytophaga sp.]MBO9700182.1 glycosyltransferase family 9 protein [Sporocytophaga sp.]
MKNILISRTDNLGDVVLTFPLAAYLKQRFPDSMILFLGKKYTADLIKACNSIDEFISRESLIDDPSLLKSKNIETAIFVYPDKDVAKICKQSGIPVRIGTSHRTFHWLYANKKISFSRKKSDLHEAQLNFKLLEGLGVKEIPSIGTLGSLLDVSPKSELPEAVKSELDSAKKKIILHPKSKGSAREWPIQNYFSLAKRLISAGYTPIITGTKDEGQKIRNEQEDFFSLPEMIDLTGKVTLGELISVIAKADGLVACSTGPLHIASALGIHTVGFYPSIKPMHAGRWKPIGKYSTVLSLDKECFDCAKGGNCICIESLKTEQVFEIIEGWNK